MSNETSSDKNMPRSGQAAFNALWSWRPDIARLITASDADPYYDDRNLPAFHRRVVELLEELDRDATPSGAAGDLVEMLRAYADGRSNHPPSRQALQALLMDLPGRSQSQTTETERDQRSS